MTRRKLIAVYLSILISAAAIGGYAYASTANPVNVSRFGAMRGGFIDNTGQFTITLPGSLGTIQNGLAIWPIDLIAHGTSKNSPGNATSDFRVNTAVTAGDWILDFQVQNASNVSPSAVFSLNLTILFDGSQNGVPGFNEVLYMGGFTKLCQPSCFLFVTYDLGGQVLTTPFTYLLTIARVS